MKKYNSIINFDMIKKINLQNYKMKIDYDNKNNIFFRDNITYKSVQQLTRIVENINNENTNKKCIKIHLTSEGGDAEAGLFCYDQLKLSALPIHMYGEGFVISAASLIFMAGQKRFMTEHSKFLIHQISHGDYGTYKYMKDQQYNNDCIMRDYKKIYLAESKLNDKHLDKIINKDIYLNAIKCKKYGIIHKILM